MNRLPKGNEFSATLNRHGVRLSAQRNAIYSFLAESPDHPTAEDIYTSLKSHIPSLSLTTVYNTLHLFVRAGVAREVGSHTPGSSVHYDSTKRQPHAHFVCDICGHITDVEMPATDHLPRGDFEIDNESTCYCGRCNNCLTTNITNQV